MIGVTVPPDLAEAPGEEEARRFASLSGGNQVRLVLGVEGANMTETRQRRIARAIESLVDGLGCSGRRVSAEFACTGGDVAALCARLCAHLTDTPAGGVSCDVAELAARGEDLHLLARLALTARRRGCRLHLERAPPELAGLIEFAGLAGALGLRPVGEPEHREEAGGVEE